MKLSKTQLLLVLGLKATPSRSQDIFDFIEPLIGTTNGGHVFPGASLPFNMAKAVADVDYENQGGFSSEPQSSITGFSHMHDSGTGGSPSLGNFPLFPQPPCPSDDLNQCKWSKSTRAARPVNGSVVAKPGYFAVAMNNSVSAEMTVAAHTALYRFTFPAAPAGDASANSPVILADLTDLPNSRANATIIVDPETGRMSGTGTFSPSFGIGTYTLHFCAEFSGAEVRDTGIWVDIRASTEYKNFTAYPDGVNNNGGLPAGAFTRFTAPDANNQILARVGVSFMSVERACEYGHTEIPDFDFEGTRAAAEDLWREDLSPITIDAEGVSEELQTVFWSGVYRTFLSPQDYTNENPRWESPEGEKYFDSFYCIWDSFRSIHPLITLVNPQIQAEMVQSLITIYKNEGKLPDCRMSQCKGFTQGGSNADVVLADAWVKNLTQGIDWEAGYEALIADAEDEPPVWSVEGRGGLKSYKELGYVATDDFDPFGVGPNTRSISRTVEYAYNDFCIAEVARGMGKTADAEKYFERSNYWRNMFKADQSSAINGTDTGFTGFLQPRYQNQTWGFEDPIFCSPLLNFTSCYLNPQGGETYEGPSWLYSFYAPGDMASNVLALGGPETFVSRLDYFHDYPIVYMGNEPNFLTVFLYHYAGRPGKSAARAHGYIPSQFNTSVNGIPGNDDSGAMGSFPALTMMGIFPNPGQNVYFITPPFFREVSIRNKLTGNTATIRNVNFDPSYEAIYIQSAMLDGEPWTRSWLEHSFFTEGGVLELTLGRNESAWGTGEEDLPPSLSTGGPNRGLADL